MSSTFTERISVLGPAQRELLERRLEAPPAAGVPLTTRGRGGAIPASPTQKSMWFVHHLDPVSPVFNNGSAVRIRGHLDVDALDRALTDLVRRHEVLRTTYRLVDGDLMQFVQPAPDSVLTVEDAGQSGELPEEVRRELEAEVSRPFDLAHDVMYRAVLHRLGDDDHVLSRTSHHIAFDRWSVAIANREINELYRAKLAGDEPRLPDLPVQYPDFARWQLDNLSADVAQARLRFFTSHIAGVPDYLELPTDHPRTRSQGPAATLRSQMPDELASRMRAVARELGATPFMILLAAYGVLMGRYTRTEQLLVGVPVALRGEPELTDLIGPFINTVVLRLDLRGEPSFRELVERVRRTSLNMIAHQDLPFDELVRATAPERFASRTPLFQIMFDYLNTPHTSLDLEGLDLEPTPVEPATTAHDMTLYIEDQPSGVGSRWEYRADVFDRATVGALAGAYDTMVERLVAHSEARIDDIGMLDSRDEQRVRSISAGPVVERKTSNVLEALEEQRARTPDAVAVEAGGKQYTYDQIAVSARQIASGLREGGVRPGDAVALLLDRSVDLVAGILGVMMSGATALLLDRDQPTARLSEMLRTAKPAAVLTDSPDPGGGDLPVVAVGSLVQVDPASTTPSMTPLAPLDPTDPAYVVFTSGSTGKPKGVVVGHGSLGNFVESAVSVYDLRTEDRLLQFASPGFDTIVEEIFPALSVGATVVLRPEELFSSFTAFERFAEETAVTVLDLPTAWWHSWVGDLKASGRSLPPNLRLVIVGGEAARADVWRDWTRLAGGVRWINSYGPSEGTVVVSTFEPTAAYRPTGNVMPIGRPIPNTSLLVVDSNGHPVPPRVTGELVIEGAAVALGYHGEGPRSEFGTDWSSGGRRHRTGDLARLLPDGTLEFVGRLDSQVKVRGTRVEPAEVEEALRGHPEISDAVVVPDRGGDSGLVGHLVITDPGLDVASIREHLATRLTEPMIPTRWRIHESLPLTHGGKHDRRMLERLEAEPVAPQNGRIAPRSDLETTLLGIWESVLGMSEISMTDSFFDLGGHSLLGIRMISRISSALDVELPLRVIFETPTIESMARFLEAADA